MAVFREYRDTKQTVVLVTHSMDSVTMLCNRALMLEDGKVVTIGDVKKVAEAYQRSNLPAAARAADDAAKKREKKLIHISGNEPGYKIGDTMRITLTWPDDQDVSWVGVSIIRTNGERLFDTCTGKIEIPGNSIDYEVELNLGYGDYYLSAAIQDKNGNFIEAQDEIATFSILNDYNQNTGGLARMKYKYVTKNTKAG